MSACTRAFWPRKSSTIVRPQQTANMERRDTALRRGVIVVIAGLLALGATTRDPKQAWNAAEERSQPASIHQNRSAALHRHRVAAGASPGRAATTTTTTTVDEVPGAYPNIGAESAVNETVPSANSNLTATVNASSPDGPQFFGFGDNASLGSPYDGANATAVVDVALSNTSSDAANLTQPSSCPMGSASVSRSHSASGVRSASLSRRRRHSERDGDCGRVERDGCGGGGVERDR